MRFFGKIIVIGTLLFSPISNAKTEIKTDFENKKNLKVVENLETDNADCYLITITEDESRKWINYTENDFSEINCCYLEDLTASLNPIFGNKVTSSELKHFNRILKCKVRGTVNELQLASLKDRSDVLNVELNKAIESQGLTSSSELMSARTNYGNDNAEKFWGQNKIQLDEAYNFLSNNPNVIRRSRVNVGVIEKGLQVTHKAFEASEIDINFKNENDIRAAYADHGTNVCSIIIGNTYEHNNETVELKPLDDKCMLYFLRENILEKHPDANTSIVVHYSDLVECMTYCTSNDVNVVNCSFAYSANGPESVSVYNSMSNYPGLIVCGAGNSGKNIDLDENKVYPACYDLPNIICVGAIDSNCNMLNVENKVASNFCAENVDVFAPGENIYVATSLNANDVTSTTYVSGTSFSAPFVTGLASLLMSVDEYTDYGDLLASDIKKIIMNTVTNINTLTGKCKTNGYINAKKAVEELFATYENSYEYVDDNYHRFFSKYGSSKLEEHEWIMSMPKILIGPRNMTCTKCGATKIVM